MDMRGLHGGPLANAVAAEAMTSVLISVNRRYGVTEGAGIKDYGHRGNLILQAGSHHAPG